jgi:hypothetical protein
VGQAIQKERIVYVGNPIENDAGSHLYSLESSRSCWPWSNLVPLNCVPRCLDIRYVTLRLQLQTFCVNWHVTKFAVQQTHNIEISRIKFLNTSHVAPLWHRRLGD